MEVNQLQGGPVRELFGLARNGVVGRVRQSKDEAIDLVYCPLRSEMSGILSRAKWRIGRRASGWVCKKERCEQRRRLGRGVDPVRLAESSCGGGSEGAESGSFRKFVSRRGVEVVGESGSFGKISSWHGVEAAGSGSFRKRSLRAVRNSSRA